MGISIYIFSEFHFGKNLQLSSTCLLTSSSAGKTWFIGARKVCNMNRPNYCNIYMMQFTGETYVLQVVPSSLICANIMYNNTRGLVLAIRKAHHLKIERHIKHH